MRIARRDVLRGLVGIAGLGSLAAGRRTGRTHAVRGGGRGRREERLSLRFMGSASADPAEPGIAVLSGLAGFADRLAQEGLATTFRWTGAPATPHETTLLLRGFTPNDATLAGHIVQLRGRLDPGAAWLVAVPRQAFSPHDQEPRVETLIRRNPAGVAYNEAVSTHRDAPRVTTGVALVDRSTGGTLASFGLTGA